MNDFQVLSITPMSEREHPRQLAKAAVAKHRQQAAATEPEVTTERPPSHSIRAVHWAASTGRRRSWRERVRDRLQRWLQ
jgi:hypothetical protein